MENTQVQPTTIDTRVQAKKSKKREFKNRKTFSLKAMEELVDRVSFLKSKYDALAVNAQEKLGYHYNEILNILLFHKYVKSNKKLFDMYKKIKDAVNKGYEFEKNKKVQENTMGKMMNESKSTHFAINKNTNKILESWNYEGYDHNELKEFKDEYFTKDVRNKFPFLNEKHVTVVTKENLTKRKLNENSKSNWQKYTYTHFALLKETNHILFGYNYDNVSQEELNENKKEYFLNILTETYGSEIQPKDVVIIKESKLAKLGINNSLNKENWVGLINEAYCGKQEEELDEDFGGDVGSAFPNGGIPVMPGSMDLSPNQDMYKAKNMKSSVKRGIKKYQTEFSNPVFHQTSEPEFITPVKTTHFQGTKRKAMKENYDLIDLIDLDALMNDGIEYRKIETIVENKFKSPKLQLLRENNRHGIIEFLVEHQGHNLSEVYNRKQFNTMSLKTLNEHYAKLVQLLQLNEEIKPKALVDIAALNKQTQKDSNNYYKTDASNKTTTMLVQKGEGDGLVYDKDSRQRKDIPKYDYQSEAQKEYLEKIHRGLEDVQPENNPNGEVNAKWEARKKALMGTQEVGKKAYDSAKKRIQVKKDYKLGEVKPNVNQSDMPKVPKDFKVLKESSILDQVQSFYVDNDNRKKPVIFDSNDVVETFNESKLAGCKELTYKGLGQTLSENFKSKVLNKKLLYSIESKKVYLV